MQPYDMNSRNQSLVTPFFKTMAELDKAATKKEGRPIYKDVEYVEIRIAGDQHHRPCYPAHSFWQRDENGNDMTYAMRWSDQYRKWKEGSGQAVHGTPIEELPFLTQAKRSELKALSIYTAEALASLDGKNLKTLGIGGRELKDQAQAYLDKAKGSADVTRFAAENADLKAQLDELRRQVLSLQQPSGTGETDDELKARIKELTGAAPRGTPSRETLLRMIAEAEQHEAA